MIRYPLSSCCSYVAPSFSTRDRYSTFCCCVVPLPLPRCHYLPLSSRRYCTHLFTSSADYDLWRRMHLLLLAAAALVGTLLPRCVLDLEHPAALVDRQPLERPVGGVTGVTGLRALIDHRADVATDLVAGAGGLSKRLPAVSVVDPLARPDSDWIGSANNASDPISGMTSSSVKRIPRFDIFPRLLCCFRHSPVVIPIKRLPLSQLMSARNGLGDTALGALTTESELAKNELE